MRYSLLKHLGGSSIRVLLLILGTLILTLCSGPVLANKDQECLVCHREVGLKRLSAKGELNSLHVNPDEWERDVHHQKRIKCIDCHEGMTPFSHPKEGARKVVCGRCHPGASEENQLNIHNTFIDISNKSLPECFDCHSKHRVRAKDDPESTVNPRNIGKTCYACHQEIVRSGIINLLPTQIILGHRQCDVNERFDLSMCINCHGDAGHGSLTSYPEYCSRCHNTKKKPSLFSSTHSLSSSETQPLRFFMEHMSLSLNLVLIVGVLFIFLIYVIRFHKMRK
jgi:hypothetical protein